MKDERDIVFKNIRQALAERPAEERAVLPEWESSRVVCKPPQAFGSLVEHFRFKFEAAAGVVVEGFDSLAAFLRERQFTLGYADPALRFSESGFQIEATFRRERVDEYEFCLTRATAAIAETGSLVITATDTPYRLAALAPWVHVAVLERAAILPDMPSAIARFGDDRATLFVTGPSKTADVEGILIQGVHGPGVQVCCLV